jgi:hypothetical protein
MDAICPTGDKVRQVVRDRLHAAFRAWRRAMAVTLAALLWCCAFLLWRDADEKFVASVFAALAVPATGLAWRQVRAGLDRDEEPGPPPSHFDVVHLRGTTPPFGPDRPRSPTGAPRVRRSRCHH